MTRLVVAALAVTLAGCATTSDDARRVSLAALAKPTAAAVTPTPTPGPCKNPTASLRPRAGPIARGSFMDQIRRRGSLIAGVDQNSLRLAYLRPSTKRIEGFEIDLLHELARALFGDPRRLKLRAITTGQRESMVQSGKVDIVVDAMTVNCLRRQLVDFSAVYLDAGLRLLVPTASRARSLSDLRGRRVCATKNSTTLRRIERDSSHPVPFVVAQRTDCLVALQRGEVAAIASDDAILLGFHEQDPNTKLIGPRVRSEPYGMAIDKRHPEFVRYVNGVLEQLRRNGGWRRLHQRWLSDLPATATQPAPRYAD